MNELYKTITTDAASFFIFMFMFGLISFSVSILVASIIKTVIDYYFTRQYQYLTSLAKFTAQSATEVFNVDKKD